MKEFAAGVLMSSLVTTAVFLAINPLKVTIDVQVRHYHSELRHDLIQGGGPVRLHGFDPPPSPQRKKWEASW